MPASASAWAAFFTGSYALFVDDDPVAPAALTFTTTGDANMLQVMISGSWTSATGTYMRLRGGPIPGGRNVGGGFIAGTISPPGYGHYNFHLGCFELVEQAGAGWVVGMDPTGQNVGTRFDGKVDEHLHRNKLVLNFIGSRKRPDMNYPWNLP